MQEYWILDPETEAHRFYARQGEILVEFARDDAVIRSKVIPGFCPRRDWLKSGSDLAVSDCLASIIRKDEG